MKFMTLPELLWPLFLNTGSGHCWPWEGGRRVFRRGRIPQRGHSVCQGACSGCTCLIGHTSVIQLETDTEVKKATVCLLLTKPSNQLISRPSGTLCSKTPLTMLVCLRRVRGLLSARLVKIQNKAGVWWLSREARWPKRRPRLLRLCPPLPPFLLWGTGMTRQRLNINVFWWRRW